MSESREQPSQQPIIGALLKGLVRLFSLFPLSVIQVVGTGIGYLMWWLPTDSRRIVRANIAVVYPELNAQQQALLVKRNLIETAKATTELGAIWCWPFSRLHALIREVHGQSLVDEAIARGKGVIFLAPHIGNWEIISPIVSDSGPSTFLYRPPNVPSVESFMVAARSRFGATLAPTDVRGVRALIKALKQGELTVILPDQDPGESGGVYASFYGRPARTMTLVSKLIQKTDCAVLFMVVKRLPGLGQGYAVHYLPADAEALASHDEVVATTALNEGVERCIELVPEQYLWAYKRYRRPPQGVEDIYRRQ